MLAEPIRFKLWLISFENPVTTTKRSITYESKHGEKSCLPIFQMPLSAKQSIHERSSASLSSSSSFLVSSLIFYNFSSSFLKHGHRRQRKASSWSTSSPAEEWHTSSCNSGTKLWCLVELLCNHLRLFAYSLSAWHVKHSIARLYTCDASWRVNFTGGYFNNKHSEHSYGPWIACNSYQTFPPPQTSGAQDYSTRNSYASAKRRYLSFCANTGKLIPGSRPIWWKWRSTLDDHNFALDHHKAVKQVGKY